MPFSSEDIVQENSGTSTTTGTSYQVTLPSGTTAGNTLLIFTAGPVSQTAPAGVVTDKSAAPNLAARRKSDVGAGETSWTFTFLNGSAALFAFSWYVAEVANMDPVEPLDASASNVLQAVSNGGTLSTGTTPLNAGLNTALFAVFAVPANGTSSWSDYTNDFEEILDIGSGNGASDYQLAVARTFVAGTTGQFSSTATLATSLSSPNCHALIVAYRAADSPIVAPLAHLQGFEQGTDGGATSHNGATSLYAATLNGGAGTWGTNLLVQAASARNSSYGFRVVASGAAAYRRLGNLNAKAGSFGWDVRVVSATGTVVVNELVSTAGTALAQLLYDTSTSKFGVRCGTTGTVSWQSGTTATNTWVWVDVRLKVGTTTWQAEWTLETGTDAYTPQAAAELTGQTATLIGPVHVGGNAAQTTTADYDNIVMSTYWVAYPLGPHQVRLLTVDTGSTPSVSGTTGNFSVFTANGTLGAWNATNARNAVDEVPPTVSASADGVCQTAVAASDYIEFPMAPCTLADDEVVSGVRSLVPMWGGTGAGTGTVGVRGWDGTTETILTPASTSYDAGSPTVISATEPRWECAMWPSPNGWTQAELDALALRFGFSTDAAPDMGCHALYLEYATKKARTQQLFGDLVTQAINPNTEGIRAITVDTTLESGKSATLRYEVSGTPTDVNVPADTTQTEVIDAPDQPTINRIELYPDPES